MSPDNIGATAARVRLVLLLCRSRSMPALQKFLQSFGSGTLWVWVSLRWHPNPNNTPLTCGSHVVTGRFPSECYLPDDLLGLGGPQRPLNPNFPKDPLTLHSPNVPSWERTCRDNGFCFCPCHTEKCLVTLTCEPCLIPRTC